ncbi:MAG: BON domain-containing protein [Terriglobales bacterium]
MKVKISVALAAMLLALGLAVGCSKSATQATNDAQIIGEVTTRIQGDPAVQTKAVAIQSSNGVVTLSGQVASDTERVAIAADAAQVQGVKTVVNDLATASAAAMPAPTPVPVPEPVKSSARRHQEARRHHDYRDVPAPAPPPSNTVAQVTPTPVVETPVIPPPPPKPATVTIPQGTQIAIRLIDPLDSETNQIGDRFRATIAHSLRVGDQMVIPIGTDVEGRVTDVRNAAHFAGKSVLAVELTNLSMGGKNYELHTHEIRREGASRGRNTAEKVGGGAAVGAILGGIIGGGRGAAIGATAGAGAGGGVQAATRGQQISLPTESALNFQLASPITVMPTREVNHRENRPVLTDRTASNGGNNNNNYSDNDNNNVYTDNNDQDSTDRPVLERRPPSDNNSNNNNQPN